MAEITAKMVNELRQRTGAGMMDCKKALVACDGDMERAQDELRRTGVAKAASKSERTAKDGLIRIFKSDERHGAMLVLNCETDFVAKNDKFQQLADDLSTYFGTTGLDAGLAGRSLRGDDTAPLLALPFKDGQTIGEAITGLIAVIGENMGLGAVAVERSDSPNDHLESYLHGNRVGVLVCLTTGKPGTHDNPRFKEVAGDVAKQIAAGMPTVPQAVSRDDVDPALIEHERGILLEQAMAETAGPNFKGDPQEIAQKKVAGRLGKFFEEIVLLEQPYIRDDKQKIADVLKAAEKDLDDTITVARFHRFELGG